MMGRGRWETEKKGKRRERKDKNKRGQDNRIKRKWRKIYIKTK